MRDPAFQVAFDEQERRDRIANSKLASVLAIILMPFGLSLDLFVHREFWQEFLLMRIAASVLIALVWVWFHFTGEKHDRVFGVLWYMIPTFFMSWMIYHAGSAGSALEGEPYKAPYYAGLNIVLLAVGLLSPWTYKQNLLSAGAVIGMYLMATFLMKADIEFSATFNNLYFLFLTAVIVVAGSYASYRQRFREFELRWELDRNRRIVEESNRKLVELDQIKSRFFANVSHELRTPLTLLLAPLESLILRFTNSDSAMRETLHTMHSNGMRLLKLINDLLDLVRMESGRMSVKSEPIVVADFIKGLASAVRQVAQDKRIQLETKVDPELKVILGDPDKIEKIVLNLVFNALKFTPSGGRVELQVIRKDQEVCLIVSDTGMGIAAKNLAFVFDRFWQADDSSRRKYQGVGIGLALVKELTEIQGGTVRVESTEGKGTTFTVQLPYRPTDQLPAHAPVSSNGEDSDDRTVSSEEWVANLYRRAELFPAMTPLEDSLKRVEVLPNGSRPRAVVADDEPDMLRFLKSQLSSHYEVLEAVDGQQAIEKAAQFLPDIILLDMMMPEKDGLQACRELRERTSTQSIPIILLTARADEETKLAALEAGASDFLPKPFSTTELHVRIRNLVESHQYQRDLSKQNRVLESTIEQLKETEMQLVQTEKLASLGRMSAGIIHEINNPLNFATTGLYTLRAKGKYLSPEQQQEYAEVLKDVEEGITRVKTIVSDLRMFTHPDAEHIDQVEVTEVVGPALRFLSSEWKDKVHIEQNLVPDQTIWANKNKLIQVVTNLLQNSLDAINLKKYENEQPTIWIEGRVENGRSILIIRDNGAGIAPEHQNKIFDPFFTTKDVGEGMGLGLSICYRIVRESDGRITVRTEPGKFCEFALEFPAKG